LKLSQNTLANLLGSVLPLILTLVTIPPYVHLVGDVRFGLLAIVWLLLSYFGLFEMGLGRATSKYIAEVHDAPAAERESLFWTVLAVNLAFGLIGGLIMWATGASLLGIFKIPDTMRPEVLRALPWIASAVPLATVVSVFVGALEGRERFLSVNALQVAGGCVFQVVPLTVAYLHGPDLQWLIASSVMSRAVVTVPMFFACRKHVPLAGPPRVETRWIRVLFAYGGWISVSGIINPILVSLDRTVVGLIRGAAAVTYYTVPFSFATKFLILPVSISRTLFPRFSMQNDQSAKDLARDAVVALAVVMTPLIALALVL
jgi:O-antigen/teichoic acid export membrane protein